ncbi:MAG: hypothetical protein M3N30_04325, partial [Bacteroidota bacterium]|nr:hypothetical protein [Bacteroidota bacterium]
ASKTETSEMKGLDGALVHLASKDFKAWQVKDPMLTDQKSVPECPDYFLWNGWYYLIYSDNSNTYYVKSKSPYGPWQEPVSQALNEDWANVVKTAAFGEGRRIAAAWVPSRLNNKDNEREIFGGNAIFREVIQEKDGSLSTKFPPEMIPETAQSIPLKLLYDSLTVKSDDEDFLIRSPNGVGAVHYEQIPSNCRITLKIKPQGLNEEYGLILRSNEKAVGGYKLGFSANDEKVSLGNTSISAVRSLNDPVQVDIILKDDIIDVCIDNRRCIVNRTIEQKGDYLWLYVKHGDLQFTEVNVYPLKDAKSDTPSK